MATHLLPCDCGQSVRVEPRQSGEEIACECGARMEVPPLTKLRALPVAEDAVGQKSGSGWGFRQGVLTAGAIFALSLAGAGAAIWSNEPPPPAEFSSELRGELVTKNVSTWTPKTAFEMWRWEYQPVLQKGQLEAFKDPREKQLRDTISRYQIFRWTLFGLAGIVGVGAVVAAVVSGQRF